jgi:hypothetical protein
MAHNDNPRDPAQLSLGGIIANLPAVRAARKANTMSRSLVLAYRPAFFRMTQRV